MNRQSKSDGFVSAGSIPTGGLPVLVGKAMTVVRSAMSDDEGGGHAAQ